jgi:hypothetical protein
MLYLTIVEYTFVSRLWSVISYIDQIGSHESSLFPPLVLLPSSPSSWDYSHTSPCPYCFWIKGLTDFFAQAVKKCNPPASASQTTGITDVHHHTRFINRTLHKLKSIQCLAEFKLKINTRKSSENPHVSRNEVMYFNTIHG